jgi:hypothetical protein
MASSYLNIFTFLLTTLGYYMLIKPNLTYEIYSDTQGEYKNYMKRNYMFLAIYLFFVIIVQFIVNTSIVTSSCGGSVSENIGTAGFYTFLPWTLIFGVIIVVISAFPGFKSAFSDVIGYFYVSSSANKLLTELLVNPKLENAMNSSEDAVKGGNMNIEILEPTNSISPMDYEESNQTKEIYQTKELYQTKEPVKGGAADNLTKKQLQDAADTIMKICGNTSVLINQIVPSNFNQYWNILRSLMKDEYVENQELEIAKKKELFELVVTRDNVGESLWYIYTGILVCSMVQLKLTTKGCANNPTTMENNYQKFLDQEKENQQAQQQATSQTYTITS